MLLRILTPLCVVLVTLPSVFGQVNPGCTDFTVTLGLDERPPAQALGGGNGPEDVAWNGLTRRIYVLHDALNSGTDIILEYDLQGNLLGSFANTPGTGGLCAMPNSPNLLLGSGSQVREIDATGAPVPGGVNLSFPGYGNIQDLDFDAAGNLWIHNGNTGDFSTVNLATGVRTPRFVTGFGSQGLAFDLNGGLWVSAAFFNAGPYSAGTIILLDPLTGLVSCYGATSGPSFNNALRNRQDPCVANPGSFTVVNGLAWIAETDELLLSNFSAVQGTNVARLAQEGTGRLGVFGQGGLRADGVPLTLTAFGDGVLGSSVIRLRADNVFPGGSVTFGVSLARDCSNPAIGTNGSLLYLDLQPQNQFYLVTYGVSQTFTEQVFSLATVPISLQGAQFFAQFATNDILSPSFDLVLSNGAWATLNP